MCGDKRNKSQSSSRQGTAKLGLSREHHPFRGAIRSLWLDRGEAMSVHKAEESYSNDSRRQQRRVGWMGFGSIGCQDG